jgi:hypothetical protein
VLRVTTSDPDKVPTFAADPNVTVFTGPRATSVRVPVVASPTLVADDVPFSIAEDVPLGPAQPSIATSVTTGAPGAGVREPGVTSTMYEFDVRDGFDNARMVVADRGRISASREGTASNRSCCTEAVSIVVQPRSVGRARSGQCR